MPAIRLLTHSDYAIFDAFLARSPTTTMFLRSNAMKAGLDWQGEPYQAHYFGSFDIGQLIGVLALNWNGNIMLQLDQLDGLPDFLNHALAAQPDFQIKGVLGPDDQAQAVLQILQAEPANIQMSNSEDTYVLELAAMRVPQLLHDGRWRVVPLDVTYFDTLLTWAMAYDAEALGEDPAQQVRDIKAEELQGVIDRGTNYLLLDEGQPAARAGMNAQLPDSVQIGPVYTPPELRGRGYAKGIVAGMLQVAQARGVERSVLFTKNPAAVRSYEGLGYQRADEYHLTLFKQGFRPQLLLKAMEHPSF